MDRAEAIKLLEGWRDTAIRRRDAKTFDMAIAAMREQEQSKWISVKERLPDLELEEILSEDMDLFPCLAVVRNERARGGRYVTKAWYDGEIFMDSDCVDVTCNVTHWMPLPSPPKEGAERTCETCYANDMEHDEVDNPCWNCKGTHSEWSPKEGAEG